MKNKFWYFMVLCALQSGAAFAQLSQLFNQIYPIGDNPNINWMSPVVKSEPILFQANPIVKFSFYNNIFEKLVDCRKFAQGYYINYTPEIRMYNENSDPVRMPSYRILLGFQHVFRIDSLNLFSYALESGHYSNGQDESALSSLYPDGSKQSDSVIATINSKTNLSNMLNRMGGEFSTDLTQLQFNYRINRRFKDYMPRLVHSITAGIIYYHNNFLGIFPFGGYADNLIPIYGHWRFTGSYELTLTVGKDKPNLMNSRNRIIYSENFEYISGAHPFVNPIRSVLTGSFFFRNNFGFFGSYIYGHDDYNIRFVDSRSECSLGICWSIFPLFKITQDNPNLNPQPTQGSDNGSGN